MGLHLCYRLTLPGDTTADDVRGKLAALKSFADTVGFDQVLGPSEYTRDELVALEDRDFVKITTSVLSADPPDFYVDWGDPCALAFVIVPGAECEAAIFGFLAPGARSDLGGADDDLHPGEWFWSAACKTQYASLVSDEHLIKCHVGLVRVLDHASTLGIMVSVEDETGYWDSRSTDTLLAAVRDMNRLIARLAGAVSDRLGEGHRVEAPIFDHPNFEHLEMEAGEGRHQADGADPEEG